MLFIIFAIFIEYFFFSLEFMNVLLAMLAIIVTATPLNTAARDAKGNIFLKLCLWVEAVGLFYFKHDSSIFINFKETCFKFLY